MVFTLIVKLRLKPDDAGIAQVKSFLQQSGERIRREEKDVALSWTASQDAQDKCLIYLVERYENEEKFKIHQANPAFMPEIERLGPYLEGKPEMHQTNEF